MGALNVWSNRGRRLAWKFAWDASTAVVGQPEVSTLHEANCGSTTHEFVRRTDGPCYIEPDFGYIISDAGGLVADGLTTNFDTKSAWRIGVSSPGAFRRARSGRLPVREVESVISLRHFWDWNYYHFHIDVLGELELLDEAGVDPMTPIVLGKYASQLSFPSEIIRTGRLSDRTWIIQGDEHLHAKTVFYAQTRRPHVHRMDHVLDLMGVPADGPSEDARVFLTRSAAHHRRVLNEPEITDVFASYGFRIVQTENMSHSEQIDLFSNTRYLVAVHGAGITNVIYRRRRRMGVMELHTPGWLSIDFRAICVQSGYDYLTLACTPDDHPDPQLASMTVDRAALTDGIERLLSS